MYRGQIRISSQLRKMYLGAIAATCRDALVALFGGFGVHGAEMMGSCTKIILIYTCGVGEKRSRFVLVCFKMS